MVECRISCVSGMKTVETLQRIGRYVDSLGCKEPWREYLRREVGWAEEALARCSDVDDVPQRHTDLFRERKIRVTTAESSVTKTEIIQKWSYDVLKEMLAEVGVHRA